MTTVVGIDLGTTFSAIAVFDETGRPVIIRNAESGSLTPSVISFIGGDHVEVGSSAAITLWRDDKTFGRFKREMGSDKVYPVDGKSYTPTELSAFVLRKLKEDAEKQIGPIDEAVVTIPANFANEAREATKRAAELAGLKVDFIVNEPTAAALYYAFKQGNELSGTYGVYDLGGGTFDISIIDVSGKDIEVRATEGLANLGGDDFDEALRKLISEKYKALTGAPLDEGDFPRDKAEDEKKVLSKRPKTLVRVRGSEGARQIEVTRTEFEAAISSYIAQTELLCETALEDAGIDASDIRELFLVGGSTRIPCVVSSASRVFAREPVVGANVDEVVALGAALYAAFRTDHNGLSAIQRKSVAGVQVQERTSKCFGTLALTDEEGGIGTKKQINSIVIPKGEPIPCERTELYQTVADGQTEVSCSVTESAAPETDPRFVKIIWNGDLDLPPGRPAGQEIAVTYSYDENQIMKCSFQDVATGKTKEVDLAMGGGASGKEESDVDRFTVE